MKIAAAMWFRRCSGVLSTALALSLFVPGGARAQGPPSTYTLGYPVVGAPGLAPGSSASYVDATQMPTSLPGAPCGVNSVNNTSDAAAMIQQAICALPAGGGTVDARGFGYPGFFGTGVNPAFHSNPFADPSLASNGTVSTKKNVVLLLPAGVINVYAVVGIPRESLMKGQGSTTTILQVANDSTGTFPGFNGSTNSEPTNNCNGLGSTVHCFPVICMGLNGDNTSNNYTPLIAVTNVGNSCENPASSGNPPHLVNNPRVQVEDLMVDVNPVNLTATAWAVAVQNITAQEKSWVRNVQIADIGSNGMGISVADTGSQGPVAGEAQNSGPYTNLEINWQGTGSDGCTISNAIGIYNQNLDVTIGSGGHITFNGVYNCSGSFSSLSGVQTGGGNVHVENIHCENYNDCVEMGNPGDSYGSVIDNISADSAVTNVVHFYNTNNVVACASGLFQEIPSSSTNLVEDDQQGGSTNPVGKNQHGLATYCTGKGNLGQNNNFYGLTIFGNGTPANPSITFQNSSISTATPFGFYAPSATQIALGLGAASSDSHQFTTAGNVDIISGGVFGMTMSGTDAGAGNDTGISRDAAGIADVGNGNAQDTSGTLRASRLQTGSVAPTSCTLTTGGGGTGSGCALDTGSTDSAGIIEATIGSSVSAGTGTITLTFSTSNGNFGSHNPSCVYNASDNGTGSWNGLAVIKDKSPTDTADLFTWTNGSGPTPLTPSKTYWINYHCWAK